MDNLLEQTRALPRETRQRIAQRIEEMIQEEIRLNNGWTLGDYYLATMRDILGVPVDDRRTLDNFYARVVVAVCLYDAGYTQVMIGKVLKRNHSTIHHYLATWRDARDYPTAFAQLRWLYDRFKKAIENDGQ